MSNIQPGTGYNFSSSGLGTNLNIEQPIQSDLTGLMIGIGIPDVPDFPNLGDLLPWPDTDAPEQFEVQAFTVGDAQRIRIAKGSVTFTQSNMPEVFLGAATDTRQAWIRKVAVADGVTVTNGGDSTSPWMEDGGYYALGAGEWYVTISKMDIAGSISDSTLLQENAPFVSIFQSGSALYDKIFSETGPSIYVNQHNVQKMTGYDAVSTGLAYDFGNCHTTWFNPVKWGYAVKLIAVINDYTPSPATPSITQIQAATSTLNEIHRITIPPIESLKKSGSFQLQYAPGFTTDTTDPFDLFNPLNSGNLSGQFSFKAAQALKAIAELKGNTQATLSGPNQIDITYVGELENTAVAVPAIISNTIGVATSPLQVDQHAIGWLDVSIPCTYGGSTLMNVPEYDQAEDDPYNANEANEWNDISNYLQRDAIESITPLNTTWYDLVVGPQDWTSTNHTYAGDCIDETTSDFAPTHPFKVIHLSTAAGLSTYEVVPGTVNNEVPGNMTATITVSTGPYEVWLQVPYDVATTPRIPTPVNFEWNIGTPLPSDTNAEGYVLLATVDGADVVQFITGSLWVDRIKLGTTTARYYFARV